jgi:hypothetical protein
MRHLLSSMFAESFLQTIAPKVAISVIAGAVTTIVSAGIGMFQESRLRSRKIAIADETLKRLEVIEKFRAMANPEDFIEKMRLDKAKHDFIETYDNFNVAFKPPDLDRPRKRDLGLREALFLTFLPRRWYGWIARLGYWVSLFFVSLVVWGVLSRPWSSYYDHARVFFFLLIGVMLAWICWAWGIDIG